MALEDQDIEMYAGDNKTIEFSVVDDQGAALNITGASIQWVMRLGSTVMLSKSTADDITITNGAGGIFEVALEPEDTETLAPLVYDHGANVSIQAGDYITVAVGKLTIYPKVRV